MNRMSCTCAQKRWALASFERHLDTCVGAFGHLLFDGWVWKSHSPKFYAGSPRKPFYLYLGSNRTLNTMHVKDAFVWHPTLRDPTTGNHFKKLGWKPTSSKTSPKQMKARSFPWPRKFYCFLCGLSWEQHLLGLMRFFTIPTKNAEHEHKISV